MFEILFCLFFVYVIACQFMPKDPNKEKEYFDDWEDKQ